MKKTLKRLSLLFLLLLIGLGCYHHKLIGYGIGQLKGQLEIINNAQDIDVLLADTTFPDSLKSKLLIVQEAKRFAIDSLGINPSENYTTVYDQRGNTSLWVVTACEPYALKDYEWTFPVLGTVSYKGFFDHKKAEKEAERLGKDGYDTSIREVTAWSTLGWFKDPVLTNFLKREEGDIAELIIHELTHGTVYIKDSVHYNENLANFVGAEGARLFMKQKYGIESAEYRHFIERQADSERFTTEVLKGANTLAETYASFSEDLSENNKDSLKQQAITNVFRNMDVSSFHQPERYERYLKESELPNNTFFMAYLRYDGQQDIFEKEFKEEFDGDLKKYITYLKTQYGVL